jgi:hypothetical protein
MRALCLVAMLALAPAASREIAAADSMRITDYGFEASIPDGLPVCFPNTAGHVHGLSTVLIGNCNTGPDVPAMGIWADFNSSFEASALETLAWHPTCHGISPAWAEDATFQAVPGSIKIDRD